MHSRDSRIWWAGECVAVLSVRCLVAFGPRERWDGPNFNVWDVGATSVRSESKALESLLLECCGRELYVYGHVWYESLWFGWSE